MTLNAKPGAGQMDIRHVTLLGNSMIHFRRKGDQAMERVTTIDRRHPGSEYTEIVDTPVGLLVQRTGFVPKLILWHLVTDIDYEESPLTSDESVSPTAPVATGRLASASASIAAAQKRA